MHQPSGAEPSAPLTTSTDLQRLVDLSDIWRHGPKEESFFQTAQQAGGSSDDVHKLDIWLSLNLTKSPSAGQRIESGLRWLKALVSVAGFFLGTAFMAALVSYDGSHQVNVLWLLGFTLLQLVLSLLALVYLLRRREQLPIISELVGHLPSWLYKGPLRRLLAAPVMAHEKGLQQLHTPALLLLTQRFALWFSLAALLTLLAYIVLQDIAFGWGTTLIVTPAALHGLVDTLALPWSWLWPSAVPSLELIETSRFYRLVEADVNNPAALGAWWGFLFMTWLIYAVLPRYLVLRLCRFQWQRACHLALLQHPNYQRTIARLSFDHVAAQRRAAKTISHMLAEMLSHIERAESDRDNLKQQRSMLEKNWYNWMQQREQEAHTELAGIYLQPTALTRTNADAELPDSARLFEIQDWEKWGLSKKQVAMIAGATGAAIGAGADAATGFSTLGGLAALGGVGVFAGVYLSSQIAETTSDSMAIQYGPVRNRQFPFVLLGRAFSVWRQLAANVPSDSQPPKLADHWQDAFSNKSKRLLNKQFERALKGEAITAQLELEKLLFEGMAALSEPY